MLASHITDPLPFIEGVAVFKITIKNQKKNKKKTVCVSYQTYDLHWSPKVAIEYVISTAGRK